MNAAAAEVMKDISDLCIAYGVSDEYRSVCISSGRALRAGQLTESSFVFHPSCQLFERRGS
jgi:tRNA(His) guanylyltransferase